MAELFDISSAFFISGNTTVLIEGTTTAPHGAGVGRYIAVFSSNNMSNQIASCRSELPHGTFSVYAPGLETSEFTIVAQGAPYENNEIYSHVNYLGYGSGDYTPPDILHVDFIMGEGDVTSPYVDIYHPMSEIEAEVTNQNVIFADFGLMSAIESDVTNAIVADCNLYHPMSQITSYVVNYRMIDGNIRHPMSVISAEMTNAIVIDVNINHPMSQINCDTGSETTINHPMSSIESVVTNKYIIDCNIYHRMSSIEAELETQWPTSLSLTAPAAMFSFDGVVQGDSLLELTSPAAMFSFDGTSTESELTMTAPAAMFSLNGNLTDKYGIKKYVRGEIR